MEVIVLRCFTFCILFLLLVACSTNPPASGDSARKVRGKVDGYAGGRKDLSILTPTDDILNVGSIEPDGSFSFEYPETINSISLFDITEMFSEDNFEDPSCFSINNKQAKYHAVGLVFVGGDRTNALIQASSKKMLEFPFFTDIEEENFNGQLAARFYVDGDVEIKASCDSEYDEGTSKAVFDLNLKRGWNVVVMTVAISNSNGTLKLESKGTNLQWFLITVD